MSTFFKSPEEYWPLSPHLAAVICVLNKGRNGGLGSTAVHASAKGFRITINGRTIARGSTPRELAENFKAVVDKAAQGKQ